MARITSNHYVLAVHDLKACADWYTRVLGFTVQSDEHEGWVFMRRNNVLIMAGLCPDAIPPSELGDHQYFGYLVVDDVEAFHARAVAEDGEVIKALKSEPWGMREFGLRTADGHRILVGQDLEPSEA